MIFLDLIRLELRPDHTRGVLLDTAGIILAMTMEDTDRQLEKFPQNKLQGRSAIPRGMYRAQMEWSHKFGRMLPNILNVTTHTNILMHVGNWPEDTEGCILAGNAPSYNNKPAIVQSTLAINRICEYLKDCTTPDLCTITIR